MIKILSAYADSKLWNSFNMCQGVLKIKLCCSASSSIPWQHHSHLMGAWCRPWPGVPVHCCCQGEQSSPLSASCSCISNAGKWRCTVKRRPQRNTDSTRIRGLYIVVETGYNRNLHPWRSLSQLLRQR